MTPVEAAQRILQGPWKHRAGALQACKRGEWAAFARELAPPKPGLLGRGDFGKCLELAERSLFGPADVQLTVVPLWACSTEDAVSTEWVAVHGVAEPGKPLFVQETGPFIGLPDADPRADALWLCTARQWTAATVVESRSYAPDIPLKLRAGAFAVVGLDVDEVLAVEPRPSATLPRPTREVPMFANWFEPRVAVDADLEAKIRALCFTADAED